MVVLVVLVVHVVARLDAGHVHGLFGLGDGVCLGVVVSPTGSLPPTKAEQPVDVIKRAIARPVKKTLLLIMIIESCRCRLNHCNRHLRSK